MFTIKALVAAFLAGVILAGGVTYWAVKPAPGPAPNAGLVCAPTPSPADIAAHKAREHAILAPTTGGDRPAAETLPVPPANSGVFAPSSSSSSKGH